MSLGLEVDLIEEEIEEAAHEFEPTGLNGTNGAAPVAPEVVAAAAVAEKPAEDKPAA